MKLVFCLWGESKRSHTFIQSFQNNKLDFLHKGWLQQKQAVAGGISIVID